MDGKDGAAKDADAMTDVETLRECLRQQTKVAQANADALSQLTEALKGLAPIPIAPPSADEVRTAKFEKLYMLWIKQSKFKEFKHSDDLDVCQWLLQFDSTVSHLASAACNLDLARDPLKSQ